jgi:hypothetical protein
MVEVAPKTKLAVPFRENIEPGDEVPTPRKPFGLMVRAGVEDVAVAVLEAR